MSGGTVFDASRQGEDARQAFAEAIKRLDQALAQSAQAAHSALEQLAARGKDYTDNDLKEALASLRKMQEDYVATANRVAQAATGNLRRELLELAVHTQSVGADAGVRMATVMNELALRMGSSYREGASSGFDAARNYGARMAFLASGILAGVADALRDQPPARNPRRRLRWRGGAEQSFVICRACTRSARSSFGTGWRSRASRGRRTILERAGQILHWGEKPKSRGSSLSSACGSRSRNSDRPSSSSARCFPPGRTCSRRAGSRSSAAAERGSRQSPSRTAAAGRAGARPLTFRGVCRPGARALRLGLDRPGSSGETCRTARRSSSRSAAPESAKIDSDLSILGYLAQLVESEMPEARRYRPRSSSRSSPLAGARARSRGRGAEHRALRAQLRRRAAHPDPPGVREWTSHVMNVQEHIEGIRGHDIAAIEAAGLDRKVLAERGADAVLRMIMVDGFFHADPHPGNVLYLPGNRIAMIDFGMVGRLAPMRRGQIVDLLAGIAQHRRGTDARSDTRMGGGGAGGRDPLATEIGELTFDYADVQLKDIRIAHCCTGWRRSCASTRSCCRRISR